MPSAALEAFGSTYMEPKFILADSWTVAAKSMIFSWATLLAPAVDRQVWRPRGREASTR